MEKILKIEDMADSLILTACEERLRILKETKRRIEAFEDCEEQFSSAYGYLCEVLLQEKSKILGMYLLLYKSDYIDNDEYFRLQDEVHDKFLEMEKNFVSKYSKKKSFGG